jgi:hypothetical protein
MTRCPQTVHRENSRKNNGMVWYGICQNRIRQPIKCRVVVMMAMRRWTTLLFPHSWQLVVVEVPADQFDYVSRRNRQIWRQLAHVDPELAREVEPFLNFCLANGNSSGSRCHNTL